MILNKRDEGFFHQRRVHQVTTVYLQVIVRGYKKIPFINPSVIYGAYLY
jgi:hypothetical protein